MLVLVRVPPEQHGKDTPPNVTMVTPILTSLPDTDHPEKIFNQMQQKCWKSVRGHFIH